MNNINNNNENLNENPNTLDKKSDKVKSKNKTKIFETVETILIALILAVFIRATVAEARYIPSESMVPTLLINDRLVVEKISNYKGLPKREDILVFYPPFSSNTDNIGKRIFKWLGFTKEAAYIKRVIGLPGETVEIRNGLVYIDNKPLDESSYIREKPYYEMPPLKIPDGELFLLGDNRNNSMDSHVWGTLPMENIIGHAVIRFWPPQRIGKID